MQAKDCENRYEMFYRIFNEILDNRCSEKNRTRLRSNRYGYGNMISTYTLENGFKVENNGGLKKECFMIKMVLGVNFLLMTLKVLK